MKIVLALAVVLIAWGLFVLLKRLLESKLCSTTPANNLAVHDRTQARRQGGLARTDWPLPH